MKREIAVLAVNKTHIWYVFLYSAIKGNSFQFKEETVKFLLSYKDNPITLWKK